MQQLFFDYCESREINKELTEKENKLELLEELVILSKEHQKVMQFSDED